MHPVQLHTYPLVTEPFEIDCWGMGERGWRGLKNKTIGMRNICRMRHFALYFVLVWGGIIIVFRLYMARVTQFTAEAPAAN